MNYQYIKTAEKATVKFFFYCNRKLDLMLKRRGGVLVCKNTAF